MKGRIKTKLIVLLALLIGGQSATAAPLKNLPTAVESPSSAQTQFNLNRVQLSQLISIKGLGPSKAKAILAYRDKVGKFKAVEELQGVRGIGPKLYAKLKPRFRL